MPPRKKTETETEAVATAGPAPEHAAMLCKICGANELHPSTTSFTCEHGTWTFFPDAPAVEPAAVEDRASVLDSLTDEEIQAFLEARAARSAE